MVCKCYLNAIGSSFLIPGLWNLCAESVGARNFEILVEDSDNGGTSSITIRIECLFAFQFWYCELCVKNQWQGGRKPYFANFCFVEVLQLMVAERWSSGAESLIKGHLKSNLFFIASAKIPGHEGEHLSI